MGLQEQFSNERAWRKGPGIPDGADIERAVLGMPVVAPKERRDDYMPFRDAVEYVKKHQPNALERSKIVRELRERVVALCDNIEMPVKFFTAVGTPLDTYHGIDAFFEQNGKIATIDISLKDKEGHKADVLVKVAFDDEGRPQVNTQDVASAAVEIASRLNQGSARRAA
jgi:hypothetical protein